MKETYDLTPKKLFEELQTFYEKKIAPHHLVEEIDLTDYKKLRRILSRQLDDLAFPCSKIKLTDETEWHDVWDIIHNVFIEEYGEDQTDEKIPLEEFLKFKKKLLLEIDEMTER